jgi:hypothetical protein
MNLVVWNATTQERCAYVPRLHRYNSNVVILQSADGVYWSMVNDRAVLDAFEAQQQK